MKTLFLVILSTLMYSITIAQNDSSSLWKYSVSVTYGYPFLPANNVDTKSEYRKNDDGTHYKNEVKNYNHIGIKLQKNVNTHLIRGLEYTYARLDQHTNYSAYNYKQGLYVVDYKTTYTKHRVLFTTRLISSSKKGFQFFTEQGLGLKLMGENGRLYVADFSRNTSTSSNSGIFAIGSRSNDNLIETIPIAFKVHLGTVFTISNLIGLTLSAGLGGPLLQAGISFNY